MSGLNNQQIIYEMKQNRLLNYRRVYINDVIDQDTIFIAREQVMKLVEYDKKKNIKPSDAEPIEIYVDSYGGSIDAGLSFISLCERLKTKGYILKTVVYGVAMSMASIIAISCASYGQKYCEPYAKWLIHTPRFSDFYRDIMTAPELKRMANGMDKTWELMKDFYLDYTDLKKEELDRIFREIDDVEYYVNDAIKLGLVDQILE